MTPEEIRKLAEEYVAKVYGGDTDFIDEAENVISWFLRTHCIVSKEKATELCRLTLEHGDSIDYGLIDGLTDIVCDIFGEQYHAEAEKPISTPAPLTKLINDGNMNEKPILDACCGGRMFYFDKHNPNVLFQDIREVETTLCDGRKFEVKLDVQADFTNMPYPDDSFRMVVFDPPHLLRNVGKSKMADLYGSLNAKAQPTGYQHIKYGALYSDWRDMLRKGFAECFRVLMPGGFLIFKWNETDIKVSEVLKLTSEKPIFGHKSGKRSNTHWLCFMKCETI